MKMRSTTWRHGPCRFSLPQTPSSWLPRAWLKRGVLRSRAGLLLGGVLALWVLWMLYEWLVGLPSLPVEPSVALGDVAWVIPMGGATVRLESVRAILVQLSLGSVRADDVYVFEDDESRAGGQPSSEVRRFCEEQGVHLIYSHIARHGPEGQTSFGRYLSRHYRFMLEAIFTRGHAYLHGSRRTREDGPVGVHRDYAFAVVLEDDLVLADDTVAYFLANAQVMEADQSVYCVSAHSDNAFYATSDMHGGGAKMIKAWKRFSFMRGNHFMAPGWMTSKHIYTQVVRDQWLDETGAYVLKEQVPLPNEHWDRFWDTQIKDRDCIYPSEVRMLHGAGKGYTVGTKAQEELYDGLRLSTLAPSARYGILNYLLRDRYKLAVGSFIRSAHVLTSLEELHRFRNANCVFVVQAHTDKDNEWNNVINGFFKIIGVGGYGGNQHFVKVRGVRKGAVFVRWLGNLVLLVQAHAAEYSSDLRYIEQQRARPDQEYVGCYSDDVNDRMLRHQVRWYSERSLSVDGCVSSCAHLGYFFAGIQFGSECWCGNRVHPTNELTGAEADMRCRAKKYRCVLDDRPCGGAATLEVYETTPPNLVYAPRTSAVEAVQVLHGQPGQSCDDVCINNTAVSMRNTHQHVCDERAYALLPSDCRRFSLFTGLPCARCVEAMVGSAFAPGWDDAWPGTCRMQDAPRTMCAAAQPNFRRVCLCVRTPGPRHPVP